MSKITPVARFLAADGSEFNSLARAESYQAEADRIDAIMDQLAPRPDNLGHGCYIQQDFEVFKRVWNELLGVAKEICGSSMTWFDDSKDLKSDPSWVGRLIDDSGHSALYKKGWFRMYCTSRTTAREYDQPYFANHESEARGQHIPA